MIIVTKSTRRILLIAICLCASVQAQVSMMGLYVSGSYVYNGENQVVQLRGVNRDGAEYTCVGTYANNDGGNIFDGPNTNSSIQTMATWKINAVRIPLNEDCWLGINGADPNLSGTNYQNYLAAYVDLLSENNMAVILDLHWTATGTQEAKGPKAMPDASHAGSFWSGVATRFAKASGPYGKYSNVIFDIFNEPHPNGGKLTTEAWNCVMNGEECSDTSGQDAIGLKTLFSTYIRPNAGNIVMIGGVHYAQNLNHWAAYVPSDTQLIASVHAYGGTTGTARGTCIDPTCWTTDWEPVAKSVPIVVGEFGSFDCSGTYAQQLMQWADSHYCTGYLAWTWDTASSCQTGSSAGPYLISDYDTGAALPGYGAEVQSHLQSFVSNACPSIDGGDPPADPQSQTIYHNSLQNGWVDYSYTTVSYTCTNPVYIGCSDSISVVMHNYGAVYWHNPTPFTIGTYTNMSLYMNGGTTGGQPTNVLLYGTGSSPSVISTVHLSTALIANTWIYETVPLSPSATGLSSGTSVSGIAIQYANSDSGATIYIDEVMLNAGSSGSGGPSGGCSSLSITLASESHWSNGAYWGFKVTNGGSTSISSMEVSISADGSISNLSELTLVSGTDYTCTMYNSLSASSQSGTFGFQVNGSPATPTVTFVSCS